MKISKAFVPALLLAAAGLFAAPAQAAGPANNLATSCSSATIQNATVQEVTGNTFSITTSSAVWGVQVINEDTSATICCSQDSAVSCSGSHKGVQILPQPAASANYNFAFWQIGRTEPWYCATSAGSPTTVRVCVWK